MLLSSLGDPYEYLDYPTVDIPITMIPHSPRKLPGARFNLQEACNQLFLGTTGANNSIRPRRENGISFSVLPYEFLIIDQGSPREVLQVAVDVQEPSNVLRALSNMKEPFAPQMREKEIVAISCYPFGPESMVDIAVLSTWLLDPHRYDGMLCVYKGFADSLCRKNELRFPNDDALVDYMRFISGCLLQFLRRRVGIVPCFMSIEESITHVTAAMMTPTYSVSDTLPCAEDIEELQLSQTRRKKGARN